MRCDVLQASDIPDRGRRHALAVFACMLAEARPLVASWSSPLVRGRKFWWLVAGCAALMALEAYLFGKGIGHF
jgi:hypothetical protein